MKERADSITGARGGASEGVRGGGDGKHQAGDGAEFGEHAPDGKGGPGPERLGPGPGGDGGAISIVNVPGDQQARSAALGKRAATGLVR